MTVKELVELLNGLPQDLDVVLYSGSDGEVQNFNVLTQVDEIEAEGGHKMALLYNETILDTKD